MFVDPSGRVKPCCRFDENSENFKFQLNSEKLSSIFKSDAMEKIRQKMQQGERVAGCVRCYEEEFAGKKSLRQRYNFRRQFTKNIDVQNPKIEWIEISTSNLCNLACRMCDSRYSSLWYDQELKVFNKAKSNYKIETLNLEKIDLDFSGITHLKFTGGEPLFDPLHLTFLEGISNLQNASKITLNYSTNCTISPSKKLIQLWKMFESVEVSLSVDSIVPEEIEYIRWPSTHKKIVSVAEDFFILKESINLKLGLRPTMSYLNIMNFDLLFQWWLSSKAQDWFNPTHITHPSWLSLTILKLDQKNRIENHLRLKEVEMKSDLFTSLCNQLISYMRSASNDHLIQEARKQLNMIDEHRNQKYSRIYKNFLYDQP